VGANAKERKDTDRYHPTQKPVELMAWCIGFFPDAQTILDPFMGSGTTLRAAKDLGRRAIGIEIEERYCAIAVERLRQEVLPLC
jgi:DNA modification methylase